MGGRDAVEILVRPALVIRPCGFGAELTGTPQT